jgi:hypothetical protein
MPKALAAVVLIALVTSQAMLAAEEGPEKRPHTLVGAWISKAASSAEVDKIEFYFTEDERYFTVTYSKNGDVMTQGGHFLIEKVTVRLKDFAGQEMTLPMKWTDDGVEIGNEETMLVHLVREVHKSPLHK